MEPTPQPLTYCGGSTGAEPGQTAPRTIRPADLNPDATLVFDVRREADFNASAELIPGALWKNPDMIDAWIGAVPLTLDLVVYCVRGGAISNMVVDRLRTVGAKARYVEGGIEAYKAAGGRMARK